MTADWRDSIGISLIRVLAMLLTMLLIVIANLFFCIINNLTFDNTLVILLFSFISALVYFIYITRLRIGGKIFSGSSYFRFFLILAVMYVILFLSSLFQVFYFPIAIVGLLLSSAFDGAFAIFMSICVSTVYSMCFGYSYYSFYGILLIISIGALFGNYLKESDFKHPLLVTVCFLLTIFTIKLFFSYLAFNAFYIENILYFVVSSIISGIFMLLGYNYIVNVFLEEKRLSYEMILDENYQIAMDLKRLSLAEYSHAVKVANISGACASLVEADRMLCMAGGLYYHSNIIEKTKSKSKFLKFLNDRGFPQEVLYIISENEQECRPSSKESAIVHITDIIITKLEALFEKEGTSTWNISMVVYQTLNESSQSGVYDKSGLSMNEFLKIRDFLANYKFI